MKSYISRYLIPTLILIVLVAGSIAYYAINREPGTVDNEPGVAEGLPRREVILYFGSQDGFSLVAEAREVTDGDEGTLVAEIVQALREGSRGDLIPVLPAGTVLTGYSEQDGIATLDFNRDLIAAHPGGSMSELLTVYGLVNTLAVNLPHIRKVSILVEGQAVETLKGHVDLRQPLAADFRFAGPSAEDAASTQQENP
ncbi:germane superfamily protein [Syntrophotalea carbinolica DSM 2380]|uniref:Germane superfamily protein n=1 Tax=Syntrophotalea carbinolica (strain DSM 2380 / NBRC 103641 / GraBd1) TaxID=338963 RepID=Q3A0Z8_SYNC1|nr:GerMN domain-containing protein [Syntrophotalea carbinolica]ABA89959.1 germane superfamily protein [Syntrophotalea carbinolica DSM 2380]